MTNKRLIKACHNLSKTLPVDYHTVYMAFKDPLRKRMKMRTKEFILFKIRNGISL